MHGCRSAIPMFGEIALASLFAEGFCEAVFQRNNSIEPPGFLIFDIVAHADKLHPRPGGNVGNGGFQLTAGQLLQGFGIQVIEIIGALGDIVGVFEREQVAVKVNIGIDCGFCGNPMDGSAHLAAVGGHAVAGFQVGGAAYLGDFAVFVGDYLATLNDIRAH